MFLRLRKVAVFAAAATLEITTVIVVVDVVGGGGSVGVDVVVNVFNGTDLATLGCRWLL